MYLRPSSALCFASGGVAECTGNEITTHGAAADTLGVGSASISRGAAAGALGVGSKGESSSWKGQQANVRRIFELFRVFNNLAEEGNPKYLLPVEFSKLSEEALCNESVFSRFVGYLDQAPTSR
jgi:hypothetical protein